MSSTNTLTFFHLLEEIATSSRRSFAGYHFTGEASLHDPMILTLLRAHQKTFPFDTDTGRFRIAPGEPLHFSDCDFSQGKLLGWDLQGAQLVKTKISHATFGNCALRCCSFEECEGYQLFIDDACVLEETRFDNCDLTRFSIGGTWQGCTLGACTLLGGNADFTTFRDCRFEGTSLAGSSLRSCEFGGSRFEACKWEHVEFWGSDFHQAWFAEVRELIGGILLEHATLGEVSPQETALRQMVGYYIQHNQAPCWRGFISTFALYPGILAWAYQVLSSFPCLKERVERHKEYAPDEERALIERWEHQKGVQESK